MTFTLGLGIVPNFSEGSSNLWQPEAEEPSREISLLAQDTCVPEESAFQAWLLVSVTEAWLSR